jgi:acyl-CoA synthetase (NDP forming)
LIDRLLHPRSIAIVGISPQPGSPGAAILRNLERFGYQAEVHLVSRNRTEVLGRPCVSTIDELPAGLDLALLLVPRAAVIDAMQACVRREITAVICYAAGFAELDAAGAAAQAEMAAIARAAGIALLGPNCLGIVSYADNLALSFSPLAPEPKAPGPSIAIVSQSGGTPSVARFSLARKGINVSTQISTGNEALLGIEDFLVPMLDDARNAAVAVFAEQIRTPQRFLAAAAHARSCGKPIVLLHPGASAAARASARSHTGALVGDHALIRAVVEDAGVVMVDTIESLVDVTELLVRFETIPARGPALITDSGAYKSIALDFCDRLGLPLPALAPETQERLRAVVPDFVGRENPIDVTAQALVDPELYARTIEALAEDRATGFTIVSGIYARSELGLSKVRTMLPPFERLKPTRPGIIAMLAYDAEVRAGEVYPEAGAAGIPFFTSPERALRAAVHVIRYGAFLERAPRAARVMPAPLPISGPGTVPEHRAKALLAQAGIAVPRGALVTDLAAAQRAAAEIGFPVALKLQAAELAHKSDVGALALGIADPAELAAAWDRLHAALRAARGDLRLDGVLVEAMAPPGIELIVGARRDPAWGTTLLAGLGGIWAEILGDTVVIPAAADEAAIVAALGRLRAAPLLAGARGGPAVDVRAAARVLAILAGLIDATPQVSEIEVNPLLVTADGALALDALIVAAAG